MNRAKGIRRPADALAAFRPGGRLTLVTGLPVITSDQASKTVVYYTPSDHAHFPVIKNGIIKPVYFGDADLSLTMSAAHTAGGIFDIFGVEVGGKGRILTGPVWSTLTAGAGDRGSGPGTTELSHAGFYVNRWAMAGLAAEGSRHIPPLEGTYLGSLYVDGSNGQVTCHVTYGQSRKWGVWNAYNRRQIVLQAGDATASWTPAGTLGPTNATSANKATSFVGLNAEEWVTAEYTQNVDSGTNTSSNSFISAIGVNSTTVNGGQKGYFIHFSNTNTGQASASTRATARILPMRGINNLQMLEQVVANSVTALGGSDDCLMVVSYMG